MPGEKDLETLLATMRFVVHDETFVWCTVPHEQRSGFRRVPTVEVREAEGVTLVVRRSEANAAGLACTFPCRMITLDVHSSLEAVGFLARVAGALAQRGVPTNAVAGFYHDHLFVPLERVEDALVVLAALRDEAQAARGGVGGSSHSP